jgi:hypothetical protein
MTRAVKKSSIRSSFIRTSVIQKTKIRILSPERTEFGETKHSPVSSAAVIQNLMPHTETERGKPVSGYQKEMVSVKSAGSQ